MSHADLGATAFGALTLATALSLSNAAGAQPPPDVPLTPPAAPSAAPAAAPAAPSAPADAPPEAATPAAPAEQADAAKPSDEEEEEADEDAEEEKDSDASPAAPTTKPSPGMLFLQSRRKMTVPPGQPVEAPVPDDGAMGTHQTHFHLSAGFRVSYLPNQGFDLFSKDDELTQLSLGFGRTVLAMGNVSLDASVLYDFGPSASTARGADTALDAHRVSLGMEGRYHVFRRLYVFGRLAPGALRWDAELHDGGADVKRAAGDWAFSADLGAGAAFEFVGEKRGKSSQARGWLLADGGYGWTTASSLELVSAEGEKPPARLQPLDLGELAFRGGFFRLALVATY